MDSENPESDKMPGMSENDSRIKNFWEGIGMSTSANIIPSFSSEIVDSLPLYYRALAQHLADTGRAIIESPSEKQET